MSIESDTISFVESIESITPSDLQGFFVGWPNPPSPNTLHQILSNSTHIVLALDTNTHRAVGLINCISDGILSAYIPLLEVLPDYKPLGIGSELVRRMLEMTSKYYMVDLCCDEALVPFYERAGMKKVAGMIWRNYERRDGIL